VRVIHCRGRPRLRDEPPPERRVRRQRGNKDLQRHQPTQPLITRSEHHRHPARSDRRLQSVPGYQRARLEPGHLRRKLLAQHSSASLPPSRYRAQEAFGMIHRQRPSQVFSCQGWLSSTAVRTSRRIRGRRMKPIAKAGSGASTFLTSANANRVWPDLRLRSRRFSLFPDRFTAMCSRCAPSCSTPALKR
jgi:hypothetical protein